MSESGGANEARLAGQDSCLSSVVLRMLHGACKAVAIDQSAWLS